MPNYYAISDAVISVCETNIEQCDQNMYPIDNYQSVYQSIIVFSMIPHRMLTRN